MYKTATLLVCNNQGVKSYQQLQNILQFSKLHHISIAACFFYSEALDLLTPKYQTEFAHFYNELKNTVHMINSSNSCIVEYCETIAERKELKSLKENTYVRSSSLMRWFENYKNSDFLLTPELTAEEWDLYFQSKNSQAELLIEISDALQYPATYIDAFDLAALCASMELKTSIKLSHPEIAQLMNNQEYSDLYKQLCSLVWYGIHSIYLDKSIMNHKELAVSLNYSADLANHIQFINKKLPEIAIIPCRKILFDSH